MQISLSSTGVRDTGRPASWGAVLALSLAAFTLVSSEFLPVSLLTPMAQDLGVSEGAAGQTIAVSGVFAVLTSLSISVMAARVDRRTLLLALTGMMIASGTIAALSPNFAILMVARAFIGVAIGGFWSLSVSTAMRLVPEERVPQALAILNGGNALAMIVAAPLGSFLGGLFGWRGAFLFIVPIAAIAFAWQFLGLPAMALAQRKASANSLAILRRPAVAFGMAAVSLFFAGQFALFTYVRPFLETFEEMTLETLTLILLAIGVSGFVGTALIGLVLNRALYATLAAVPVLMAVVALGLVAAAGWLPGTVALLAAWGLLGTAAPVGWWTWLARTLPDDAEAGGGLMVAVIQLAITLGATLGGLLYDGSGFAANFATSAALLLASAAVVAVARQAGRRA